MVMAVLAVFLSVRPVVGVVILALRVAVPSRETTAVPQPSLKSAVVVMGVPLCTRWDG